VVEGEHLTVIDPGCHGSEHHLEEGLEFIGHSLSAVERVVVTHGHMDHDGGCLTAIRASGAELWAHEVYGSMLLEDRWEREMHWRRQVNGFDAFENSETVERVKEHHRRALQLHLDRPVTDGLRSDGLTYFYTPGHSPDELCILFDGVMFTGDHVLPQITPHPSVQRSHGSFQAALPERYRNGNSIYGLKALLRSLLRVGNMSSDIAVLPAHRAFHRGQFNLVGLSRANEIVEHHVQRCHDLIEILGQEPRDLMSLTRDHFSHRDLNDSNFFLAVTEVMSHIELLEEVGDVSVIGDLGTGESGGLLWWNGTERFPEFIRQLGNEFVSVPD
jgi:glyoxylase-like metal-dependent hydrolase (beta-lactamase superfamily II)